MKINVTQEYIDNGEQRSSTHCPISNAVRNALSAKAVLTGEMTIRVHCGGSWKRYLTPLNAFRFILHFDKDRALARPFTFELEEIAP